MALHCLRYTIKEHVGLITLNRPAAGNAISQQLAHEVADLCTKINQDDNIYVVVITGSASVFCQGSEIEQNLAQYERNIILDDLYKLIRDFRVAESIASLNRPVIAAINGDAIGQGLEIALSCDIRISSDKALFSFTQLSYGLIPMDGGTQRLPRIIGRGKALELILTAQTIDAQEALAIGLVNRVVAEEKLISAVEALAMEITKKGPVALRIAKEAINRGMELPLKDGLRLETDLYSLIQTTHDRYEGVRAFLEKRAPDFRGE